MLAAGGRARLARGAGARGRDLFLYRHLAPCRLAGPTNPLGAAARSSTTLRSTGPALHQAGLRSAADRPLVRPTLAGRGHLPRSARPSPRRDPASVVEPRHRRTTPCLLALFSIVTLLAVRLDRRARSAV